MIRIAAVGDIHVAEDSAGRLRPHWAALDQHADVLMLAGDLTVVGEGLDAQHNAAQLALEQSQPAQGLLEVDGRDGGGLGHRLLLLIA